MFIWLEKQRDANCDAVLNSLKLFFPNEKAERLSDIYLHFNNPLSSARDWILKIFPCMDVQTPHPTPNHQSVICQIILMFIMFRCMFNAAQMLPQNFFETKFN